VSVVDRGEPVASCSEWPRDDTAGEHARASHLAAMAPAWARGEAPPGRPSLVGKPSQTVGSVVGQEVACKSRWYTTSSHAGVAK
jgi:hypothetical protein